MSAQRLRALSAAALLAAACSAADEGSPSGNVADAEGWNGLLSRHARDGGIAYSTLAGERALLEEYLESVAAADPSALDPDQELAFWINAYNAGVASLVLDRYPGVESIKDVGGFFDELTFEVAGGPMTLDEVEGRARGSGDPRVHFAVVCASASCPDLRGEAYVGDRLDEQLDEQTRSFLADREKGLRFDPDGNELHLSSIFKWYAGDFTGGSTVVAFFARGKVAAWVLDYLPGELAGAIRAADPDVRYLDYDWSLNDR